MKEPKIIRTFGDMKKLVDEFISTNAKNRVGSFVLIQGISGSGKSTLGAALSRSLWHDPDFGEEQLCEADRFFYSPLASQRGEYNWNRDLLKYAHEWCLTELVRKYHYNPMKFALCTNTFTADWQLEPYYKMAENLNARVLLIRVTGEYENVHNVPAEVIAKQRDAFRNQQVYNPDIIAVHDFSYENFFPFSQAHMMR